MREDILINVSAFETRVALLQGGGLAELHLQRSGRGGVTGNLYHGRVVRILPGMQAAFVDIGLERPGFLHLKDIRGRPWEQDDDGRPPSITRLLAEGQTVLVQVLKDPIAAKGARLTTHVSLASRFLVMMPFSAHVGVSQRIDEEAERERLRLLVSELREDGADAGYIARTVAEGASRTELVADMQFLARMWAQIGEYLASAPPVGLIYEDLPMHIRIIRDFARADLGSIRIDCPDTFERVRRFVDRFLPDLGQRVLLHDEDVELFERHGVDAELERALGTRIPLKSGGHMVIEQTEAMTTVDVNTGGFAGGATMAETIFRTNLEAAAALPRQLRLRNLGGIIVVDFIDMEDDEHRRQVLRALEKACEGDRARIRISGFSELGLVEISRKRTSESLYQRLCEPCVACGGRGIVLAPEIICFEVFRTLLRDTRRRQDQDQAGVYVVRASEAVIERLLDENAADLEALGAVLGRPVRLQVEPTYGTEQFDVVMSRDG